MPVTVYTDTQTVVIPDTSRFFVEESGALVVGENFTEPQAAFNEWKFAHTGLPPGEEEATEELEPVVYQNWQDVPEGAIVRSVNAPKLKLWKVDDLRTKSRLDTEDEWYLEDSTSLEINLNYGPFTLEEDVDE